MNAHVIPFPGLSPADATRLKAVNNAREICRSPSLYSDGELIGACRVLWGWGCLRDIATANASAFDLEQRIAARRGLTFQIAAEPEARAIQLQRKANRRQAALAFAISLIFIAIFHDLPARTAHAVLQAQDEVQW